MASTTAQVSLNAAASGTGTTIDFTTAKAHVSAVISAGTVTDGAVLIEASHDGTVWVELGQVRTLQALNQHFDVSGGAFRYFRARMAKSVTGAGRVTVTFMEAD